MPYLYKSEFAFVDGWYDLSLQQKIRNVKENHVKFTGTPHQADSWGMSLTLSEYRLRVASKALKGGNINPEVDFLKPQIYVFSALTLVQKLNIVGGPIHSVHSKWKNLA